MRTKIQRRVVATVAALGLAGMLSTVGSGATVAAQPQANLEQASDSVLHSDRSRGADVCRSGRWARRRHVDPMRWSTAVR